MTIESLNTEIAESRDESRALHRRRWTATKVQTLIGDGEKTVLKYQPVSPEVDHRCIELADRIQRLCRFRNELRAREYSKGAGDWLTPEQAQEKSG
jgi:hypothetical protein